MIYNAYYNYLRRIFLSILRMDNEKVIGSFHIRLVNVSRSLLRQDVKKLICNMIFISTASHSYNEHLLQLLSRK